MIVRFKSLPLVFLLVLSAVFGTTAQERAPGSYLVRLAPGQAPDGLVADLERQIATIYDAPKQEITKPGKNGKALVRIREVSKTMHIWLIQVSRTEQDMLEWLRRRPEVSVAQYDHLLGLRASSLPNDPLFMQQWQYINDGSAGGAPNADLDADLAWDISIGGVSMAGDTIVIAVIDGGINKSHPDLLPNLWRNNAEIPGDGIDNDLNGFTDDYLGWNVFSQNDDIQGFTTIHGTPVSGVIGACGNNSLGLTGVNWKVKIMFVAGGNLESELLAAYDYVLSARLRYNETNGAAGAFVVASNCSWGIDYGMPADSPLWCAAFDELGEAGIVSVAATANNPVNVDLLGDLPTTCPSEFLVTVTSLDRGDHLAPTAAWGPVHIDLGAYGEGILSTGTGNLFTLNAGTSFAAPQVAGAVGLLYAAPCPELIAEAKTDPEAAARLVRHWLLESTVHNNDLQDKTYTKGRLNLFKLLRGYEEACADCPPPFALKVNPVTAGSAMCRWSETASFESVSMRWREIGSIDWNIVDNLSDSLLLEGLSPCSPYEFALKSHCSGAGSSDWSAPFGFVSEGCCEAPAFTWNIETGQQDVGLVWNHAPGFISFKVLVRPGDSTDWESIQTFDTSLVLSNLQSCQAYQCQILGWCENAWVGLSPLFSFQTQGCGACLHESYCTAGAVEAQEEWIRSVRIGDWEFDSGPGGGGYQNLTTQQPSTPEISPGSAFHLVITPGFWGAPYKEFFRVFIDYNLDGDFEDSGEMAYDPGFAQEGAAEGWLFTPGFPASGTARMRVMMKYAKENEMPPDACSDFSFGQVEDYCIELLSTSTKANTAQDSSTLIKIYPQPGHDFAWIDVSGNKGSEITLDIRDLSGRFLMKNRKCLRQNGAVLLDIADWPPGIYFVTADSFGKLYRGKLLKQ